MGLSQGGGLPTKSLESFVDSAQEFYQAVARDSAFRTPKKREG
jgi:hypothetical protein